VNQEQKPLPDFEQRLLTRLKAVVAERGAAAAAAEAAETQVGTPSWRRRAPRLALGAGVAVAALAIVLIVSAGGGNTSKAFAVEPQQGGGVRIKIYSLEDASGLEQALQDAGIEAQVTWLPAGKVCREPHYKPSIVHFPGGGSFSGMSMSGPGGITIGIGSTKVLRERFAKRRRGETSVDEMANVTLDPEAFRSDQSVVISGTPVPYDGDPEGGSITKLGVAEGPVGSCKQVPALPSGFGAFGSSEGGGPGYTPRGDAALPQAAIAADLRRAARSAEASDNQVEAPPASGQLLYAKTEVNQLEGWLPNGHGKGSKSHPRYFVPINDPSARYALVPVLKEVWTAPDGKTRVRETLGQVNFLSDADQRNWESVGSPPPWAFDPSEHDVGRDSSGRPMKEFAANSFRGRHEFTYLSRLAGLPTEPEALRLAVEHRRGGSSPLDPSPASSPRGGATVERLLEILSEPIASPALRAAAFDALAEIPGIGFERGVADAAGRRGNAISWVRESGFGRRFIFDPHTGKVLAEAEMIFGPKATASYGAPAGTPYRETAYLQSGIVDSTPERR
jgi:hypothetical protein